LKKFWKKFLKAKKKIFLAKYFHVGLAEIIFEKVLRISEREKIFTVALSGGVFQNLLLRNLVCERLERANFKVLLNRMIPANDGGISVGQAFFAIQ